MKPLHSIVVLIITCTPLLAQTDWNKEIAINTTNTNGKPQMVIVNLAGICAVVNKDKETKKILIYEVLPNGAADKAGLRANDEIVEIDKKSSKDKELKEIASLLRGEPGTKVTVTVGREGFTLPRDFLVTREEVILSPSK